MIDIEQLKKATAAITPPPQRALPQYPGRIAHLDGDYLAYFAAGNDSTTTETARNNVASRVRKLKLFGGAEVVMIHLTAECSNKGGRFDVATQQPYQGQRSGSKPALWQYLRDYLLNYSGKDFAVRVWEDREADDGIAYNTRCASFAGRMDVIQSRDKDFRMFEGYHLDWLTWEITEVHKGDFLVVNDKLPEKNRVFGHAWFWMQLIQGDSADNIPGIPGKGPKAADIILTCGNNAEAEAIVLNMYEDHYGIEWPERVAEQAMLLWMRNDQRASAYGFEEVLKNPAVAVAARHLVERPGPVFL